MNRFYDLCVNSDVFLTTMKPMQKVVTAADVSSCLYYVHFDCVGENEDQDQQHYDEEEEEEEEEDELGVGQSLPIRASPEARRTGKENRREGEGGGGGGFGNPSGGELKRKPLRGSEIISNLNGNGNVNAIDYSEQGFENSGEPTFRRKPLQPFDMNQYGNGNQHDYREQKAVNSSESNFRRKPVPPARREKAFDKVDPQPHSDLSNHQFDTIQNKQMPARDAAASQPADLNNIPPPPSFRPSFPRPFGPRSMGGRPHPFLAEKHPRQENAVAGTPNNFNSREIIPSLPPKLPPRSPPFIIGEPEVVVDEGYDDEACSLKARPVRPTHEIDLSRRREGGGGSSPDHHHNRFVRANAKNDRSKSRSSDSIKRQQSNVMSLTLIRRHDGSQWNVGKIFRTDGSTRRHHLNGGGGGGANVLLDRRHTGIVNGDGNGQEPSSAPSSAPSNAPSNGIYIDILTPGYEKFITTAQPSSPLSSNGGIPFLHSNGSKRHSHLSPPPPPQQFFNIHTSAEQHEKSPCFRRQITNNTIEKIRKKRPDSGSSGSIFEQGSLRSSTDSQSDSQRGSNGNGNGNTEKRTTTSQDEHEHEPINGFYAPKTTPTTSASSPTRKPLPPSSSSSSSPLSSSSCTFQTPWNSTCEFTFGLTNRTLRCKHYHQRAHHLTSTRHDNTQPSAASQRSTPNPVTISELRFNLPSSSKSKPSSKSSSSPNPPSSSSASKRTSLFPPFPLPLRRQHFSFSSSSTSPLTLPTNSPSPSPNSPSDSASPLDLSLSLGRELAGGGPRGKDAKLGKLIVRNEEGLGMLDLLVAANVGVFWWGYGGYERGG